MLFKLFLIIFCFSLDSLDFLSPFDRTIFPAHSARILLFFIVDSSLLLLLKYPLERSLCCCERKSCWIYVVIVVVTISHFLFG